MNQELIAIRRFHDGSLGNVRPGDALSVTPGIARQLENNGLARLVKAAQTPLNKMAPDALGKSSAAGAEPPSSASPADPASPQTTANLFGAGVSPAKPRKARGASSSSTAVSE